MVIMEMTHLLYMVFIILFPICKPNIWFRKVFSEETNNSGDCMF